ncbi:pentatricopeptide repeat-containing protein [Tripterygium wilfordii]|uniref:Pentatricopeptide repeat-containing protein n=1 Tax=Tripterygium wilfordii TaxID=458696 RepID=A0A7J7D017_TRIWF|nr:protein LOW PHOTOSYNTHETIC EFFICIENCY 1, chloroplastic [Tripterygium wilfordii]KAF5739579.1 pentatricopeptide repeat-containing protein [Tripterygium wilfordii]
MQSVSIWPSEAVLCLVPKVDLESGSPSFSITKWRRKRWDLFHPVFNCSSNGVLLVSSISRSCRREVSCGSLKFDINCGFLSGYSQQKLFGSSVALVWAQDQQAIGQVFSGEDTNFVNGISLKSGDDDTDSVDLICVEGSNDASDEENSRGASESEDEFGQENNLRVDVRALARSLWFAKTADDVEEVLKDKRELPLQVHCSMISGFGRDRRMEPALALVEWLKRKKKEIDGTTGPNAFVYNSLLGALKQSQRFAEVEKVMNDMALEGIVPNIVTYNTLMIINVEKGEPAQALSIIEEIQKKGLIPSAATYSNALLAYRRMEDGYGALQFFVEFREKYIKGEIGKHPDEDWENEFVKLENFTMRICYQVMRQWLVKRENLSSDVLKLLTDMDNVGLQFARPEHERLVWACTREDHYVVAKELYRRIRERHSEISLSVCNHVIWLMGKAKKWWAALEIYEDLLDKGPKPNNLSYELIISQFNILLTAARERGIWRWGIRLLNKMEAKGLKPRSREWNAVLVACSKASETTAAVQIFTRMVEQGEKPTIISYGALLSALEKGRLYDEAVGVWKHMLKVGVKPNLYACTTMASVFTGQGNFRMVDTIIDEMVSSGIGPTVVTYNAIISGCARNCMGGAAYEWFHRMKVNNISPNEITYEMLIEALSKDGKPRLAYELYLRAQNEGLNLSSKAFDAIIQSSEEQSASIDVSALGPRPSDKKKKVKIRKTLTEFCNLADVPRRSKPFDRKEVYSPQIETNEKNS